MQNLIKDISALSTIPESALTKLIKKANYCICHDIEESLKESNEITEIDIGIGILNILITNEEVKYKFIPSRELEQSIIDTALNNRNPLVDILEKTLKNKVTKAYKELI